MKFVEKSLNKNENLVKQDQHFLDFPLWVLDERLSPMKRFTVETKQGTYVLKCAGKPPDATDAIFLYAFMKICQVDNRQTIIVSNRSKVLKMCGLKPTKTSYERLWDSCKRWREVSASFEGCYFDKDKKKHVKMIFGILDWANFDKEKKELTIKFNDIFYDTMTKAKLYRFIDLNYYKMLRKPISRRLYEILKKQLDYRKIYKIETVKLIEKLLLKEKYPSQLLKKINSALNEINNHTELEIILETKKTDDKRTIFIFTRRNENKLSVKEFKILTEQAKKCWDNCHGNCGVFKYSISTIPPSCEYCPGRS